MTTQLLLIERDQLLEEIIESEMQKVLMYNNRYNNKLLSHSDKMALSDLKSKVPVSEERVAQLRELYGLNRINATADMQLKYEKQLSRETAMRRNQIAIIVLNCINTEIYRIDSDYLDIKDLRNRSDLLCQYLALCMLIEQYPVLEQNFKRVGFSNFGGSRIIIHTFDQNERTKEMKKYMRLFAKMQIVQN